MKHQQVGSSLIVILVSMSIILTACAVLFQASLFFKTLSSVRIKESQAQILLLGLMRYGIALVKENYDLLHQDEFADQEAQISLALENALHGTITIRPQQQDIALAVSLQSPGEENRSCSCILSLQKQDQKLLISSFQM